MNVEEINKIEDDDKYWEEAEKYIVQRFDSEEGQAKLNAFKDAQKELVEAVKNNTKKFSDTRSELEEYLSGGLLEVDDVFSTNGLGDNIYDNEALDIYVSLTS